MRKNKQSLDGEEYNTIMDACCKVDLLHLSISIWDDISREGFHPNVQTYNIPILKFLKIGEMEEVVSIFKIILHRVYLWLHSPKGL